MISIIIPVYQAEQYLRRAVNSVVAQNYEDWELLLVDDGSTDGSAAICGEYERQDARIKSFHKNNGGQSSARNYGMERANGEYLYFMDNDDWLYEDALSKLVKLIEKYGTDIAVCSYDVAYDNGDKAHTSHGNKEYLLDNDEAMRQLLTREIDIYIWTKLYRKSFLERNNLRFVERGEEDFLFNIEVFRFANGIAYRDTPIYTYSERNSSTSHQYAKRHLEKYVDDVMFRTSYIERLVAKYYPHYSQLAIRQTLFYYVILIGAIVENASGRIARYSELMKYIRQHRSLFVSSHKMFGMSYLGAIIMACLPPSLYFFYCKVKWILHCVYNAVSLHAFH